MAYTQDTWVLNVATRPNGYVPRDQWDTGFRHFARIELPPELNEAMAYERACLIVAAFEQGLPESNWKLELTRWELRGYKREFKS